MVGRVGVEVCATHHFSRAADFVDESGDQIVEPSRPTCEVQRSVVGKGRPSASDRTRKGRSPSGLEDERAVIGQAW